MVTWIIYNMIAWKPTQCKIEFDYWFLLKLNSIEQLFITKLFFVILNVFRKKAEITVVIFLIQWSQGIIKNNEGSLLFDILDDLPKIVSEPFWFDIVLVSVVFQFSIKANSCSIDIKCL